MIPPDAPFLSLAHTHTHTHTNHRHHRRSLIKIRNPEHFVLLASSGFTMLSFLLFVFHIRIAHTHTHTISEQAGTRREDKETNYMRPKPVEFSRASFRRRCNFSLLLYSGSRRTLKQVWLVGRRSLSGPFLLTVRPKLPRPLQKSEKEKKKGMRFRVNGCLDCPIDKTARTTAEDYKSGKKRKKRKKTSIE